MDNLAAEFEAERGRLRGLAYRMLGSAAEADDAVQEAWLRLNRVDSVDNLAAWLTTVVSRVCLDVLRSRKARREDPFEVLPEPRGRRRSGRRGRAGGLGGPRAARRAGRAGPGRAGRVCAARPVRGAVRPDRPGAGPDPGGGEEAREPRPAAGAGHVSAAPGRPGAAPPGGGRVPGRGPRRRPRRAARRPRPGRRAPRRPGRAPGGRGPRSARGPCRGGGDAGVREAGPLRRSRPWWTARSAWSWPRVAGCCSPSR